MCSTSLPKQRLAQFKPIRELHLCTPGNDEKNSKNNSENNSVHNKTHEILNKIRFVYTVTFVWKGVLSSKINQITNNLIKKELRQVILMDCLVFKLIHPEKSVSSNSASKIFDFDQVEIGT